MKTRRLFFSLGSFALLLAAAAQAADDIPQPLAFARYEPMMNRSPFAVATAATPPPQAPNFAKDLFIANAAKLLDEGVVTLASSSDKNFKEYLSTSGPNKSGYAISNIEWSDRVGATKVTITKDGQSATLSFNQALLAQPVANGGVPPAPAPQVPQPIPQPGMPANTPAPAYNTQNIIRPAPIPTLPTPPPRVRGVIQRNATGGVSPAPDPQSQMQDQ